MEQHPARAQHWAVWLWLLCVALAVLQILRTPFTADLSAFLPASPDAQQRVLIEQLQSGVPARTLLLGIDGGDPVLRAAASRALAQGLRASGLFEQVQNGQSDGFADIGTWLFDNRYALSPAVQEQRFSAQGLREAFAESLSLLGTPAGNALKPLLERDPTGETARIAEAMIPSSAPRTEEGVWASRGASAAPASTASAAVGTGAAVVGTVPAPAPARALLVAGVKAPGADLDAQAAAIAKVREVATTALSPGLSLRISGAPVFAVESRAQIEKEVHWLAVAGTVLMSGVLLLAFASLPALLVALLPVATGVLGGVAVVGLVFGGVHGITLGFGATLIGEAVDYAIYYLIQARQGGWPQWLRSGWPTVRLGLWTSVCGFAALVFSGFPGLAQLGVFSMAGLVSAVLFTRYVMPVLMPNGAPGTGLRAPMGRFARRAAAWLPVLRWPLWLLGAAAAFVLVQRGDLWQAELSSLSPVSQEALALDASLRAELSAGDARTLVVVQGADLQAALRAAEAAGNQLDALVEQGKLAGYDTVTRWLPSQATQERRLGSLPEPEQLQAALQEATRSGPLTAQRLAPFVAEVQAARTRAPVTLDSLRGTALSPLVDALLLQRADGSWASLLPLQAAIGGDGKIDSAAVRQAVPQALVIDIGPELTRLYARYLGQAQTQAALGALAVVLLMAATLRSPRRLLRVCLPLLLAVVLTMGALVALDVSLGILHLVGLLLVVAVGSNYALFFDMLREQGQADDDTLASLLLANLTTVLGFGLIAFSTIPALSAIGRVVAPGALLALVLSAALIPARSVRKFS
jgi:predicted exporter